MKIEGSGGVDRTSIRRVARGSTASGNSMFSVSEATEEARAATVSAPGPLTSVESILTRRFLVKRLADGKATRW